MQENLFPHAAALADQLARFGFRRHMMTRNGVGHLQLPGQVCGREVEMIVDTGAARTVVDLAYCRSQGLTLHDAGLTGAGAGGHSLPVFVLSDAALAIDGAAIRTDKIVALDLSHVNQALTQKGSPPIQAVLGADVLRNHKAVIDYSTVSLFLKHDEPTPASYHLG